MNTFFRRVTDLDSHHRLFLALAVAAAVLALSFPIVSMPIRIIATWNAFSISTLILAWSRFIFASARVSVRTSQLQDSSHTVIFLFVITAALASLFAVGVLLGSSKGLDATRATKHVALAILTVISSWCLVHTVFALRYAHLYYSQIKNAGRDDKGEGLDFPQEKHPDFLDFAYFSFVIGMTCQVSDVQITSRRIRRIALLHGLLCFLFNTVILALSLNLASSLMQPGT